MVVTDDDKIAAVHKPGENLSPSQVYNKPFANGKKLIEKSKMAKFGVPGIKE